MVALIISSRARLVVAALAAFACFGSAAIDAEASLVPSRFQPVADAFVSKAKPKANFGRSKRLVVDGSPEVRSYIRFNVRGLPGAVSYASLQLSVMNATGSFVVRRAGANHWDENKIRFANAPRPGRVKAKARRVRSYRMTAIDVTSLVRGNGVVTFVLIASGRGAAAIASSEASSALRPQLVIGVNDAPVCTGTPMVTFEDTAATADPICIDAEKDRMSYQVVGQGTLGRASIVGGKLHYVPNPDANGTDRFFFRAKDRRKWSKRVAADVSVRPVNDAPVCAPRTLTVDEDGGGAVGHLCTDVDDDPLTVSITSAAQNGEALVVRGELRYTPVANTNGTDAFTYRARDTTLASAPATVTVFVRPVNDAPVCGNVSIATTEDIPGEVNPSCSDIDGDALAYGIATQGGKGTASAPGQTLHYAPGTNLNGPDAFAYFAFDGAAASPPATVSVEIAAVNDAPICQPLPLDTPEDTPREINPNCTDAEGDPMSYSIVSQGTKGTASLSTGRLRYVPNLNQIGPDSFTYRAQDPALSSAAATVSVSIGAVNDTPVCVARTVSLDEDGAGTTAPSCSDLDGDTLTYSIVAQGAKGTASVVAGNLRYAGNLNANGADSFTYRANDGGLSSASATVSVTIAPVNDTPVCADVTLATNEDTMGERDPACSDVDGDALTYQTASQGTKGAASVVSGKLRYLPNANANGPDSFTYQARDAVSTSGAAIVAVAIAPVNDAPTCAGVSLTTDEDVAGEQTPSCTDIDGDSLTYSIVAQGSKGTASVVAGKLRYVPNANAHGSDSFTYRASDGAATTPAATVATTIRPVNDAPTCANVSLATDEDVAGERDPSCTDIDGDPLTYTIAAQGGKGTASITGANKLRFVPNANVNGTDSFAYRASDGAAASSAPASVAVTIAPVNDAPTCANVSLATDEDVMGERDPSCSDIDGDAMTFAIVSAASKGTASVVANRLRYVPNANTNGTDSFTYRASDGALPSTPATVSATVAPINDAPTCTNASLATDEDVIGERDPACNDVDGNPLTFSIVTPPAPTKGVASVAAGRLRYDPNENVNGADSFAYRASDGTLTSGIATISVSIVPVNDAPTCSSVALSTNEDVTAQQDPSCTDIDGDPLTYSIAAQGTKGTASVVTNRLRYVPNANANGTDSFTYRANDGAAPSAPATASVSITAVNDVPTCANVTLTTNEDVTSERDPSCSDPDGEALTYTIGTTPAPTKGTATVVAGKLRYAPALNANGVDSFSYRASDAVSQSAAATVSVTINAVNDAPACANLTMATDEDVTTERDPSCTDIDGDTLTYAIVAPAAKGTASVVAGRIRYAPNTNANGADSFTYRANDGVTTSPVATVSVSVTAVNDAPVCSPLSLAIDEGGTGTVPPSCTDAEGDALSYSIASQGTKGTASFVGGTLRYVGNANASGTDSFTYRANDGLLSSVPATVSVSIGEVNDPPVCNPRTLTLDEDVVATVTPLCTDPEGDPITYSIGAQGSKGLAQVVSGVLRYTPNANANGADSFTYRASDGVLTGAPATVSVTINPVNDAPACADVPLTTNEDTMGERDPSCSDVDGDLLTYAVVAQGTKGTASVVAGKLRYIPNANATGADSFTYRANDGFLPSASATVSVTITPVNDAPVCQPLPLDTPEDTPKEINPSCTDIEGDPLSYSIVSPATKGTASVAAGKLRYVPNLNQIGADSFTYRAQDATTGSAAATVSVSISAVNDAPVCVTRTLTLDEDAAGTTAPSCSDVDGDTLTYSIAAQGAKGAASVVAGNLRYAGNLNANGADSFTYQANDGGLSSAPATVSVTINPINDAPVCTDVTLATTEDTMGERDPACSDVDGDALTYLTASQGTKGTASVVAGKLRYVPAANANGADSFTYQARDAALTSGAAIVAVSIAPANDAPTCANVSLTADEDVAGEQNPSCTDIDGDPLTYSIAAPATNGTASIAGGKLRYVSNANVNGSDSFTYRAGDGSAQSTPATVAVTIRPVNDAPTCLDVALTTDEDVTGQRDPSCSDIDGDALTYSIAAQGSKGSASVLAGKLRYAPNANLNGGDSFTYRASDGAAANSAPATVNVTIAAVNDAPTCSTVLLTTPEDTTGERDPSCSDIDGDALTYAIAGQGAKGTASVVAGKLRYAPSINANGPDSFTYQASDGALSSSAATVSVTITPVNDAPACANVTLTTLEDTTGERDPSCTDLEGDTLTYSIVAPATKGTASVVSNKLRYTPNASVTGADSFTYQASDGSLSSPIATVSVTITPANDAPTCSNVTLTTDEDVVGERDPSCSDIDGDTLTYEVVAQATKGTASIAGGKLHYVPNPNTVGTDSFTYRAFDGRAASNSATVSVTIRPTNDAPTCVNVSLTVDEDAPGERDPSCSDIDGDALTYSIASPGAVGTASVTAANKLRYVPNTNVNGADSFGYRANDGTASSTPATVSVTIRPVNDTPVCAPVSLTTNEEVAGERDPACTDVDGDALTVSIFAPPSKGTASITSAGKLRYVPNVNATGADSFTYRADDAIAISAPATVSVTINPVNDAPTCSDVNVATSEDVPVERDPACADIDGDTLTYSIVAQGTKGTASVVAGKLRYAPNANVNGTDSFTYRASDGVAQTAPATASVSIGAVNDAPVCQPVLLSTPEETPGEVDPNCADVDGNPLTYSIASQGTKGTASVVAGKLHYAPNANATGADSFTYQASDGLLTGTPATVSVTIAGVNDPPVCVALTLATNEDVSAERDPSCTDVDNDPLTYSIASQGSKGTASVVAGKLRYAPNANVNGTDVFSYRAGDGAAQSSPVNVTVTIAAVNDAPSCADVPLTTNEEVAGERDPACTDVDGDTLSYAIFSQGSSGTASVVGGKLRYVPNGNANGSDSFKYRALDATTQSGPATVSVTINPVNDAPTCSDVTLTTNEDAAGERDPVCGDIDGDSLTYSIATQATNGTASVAAGKLRYVPNASFNGADSFSYRAGDGTTSSAPANVSVTVTPVNDGPSCPARTMTIAEDSEGSITPVCSDPEGDAVSLQIVGQGLKGTASVVGNSLRYVANANQNGVDSFTYRGTDGTLPGAPATVTVTINPANDAPVCSAVTLTTNEDTLGERDPSCMDIDGDGLSYAIVAPAARGTASVVTGKLRYVPNLNTNGADSFTYQASDGAVASAAATVSVTVNPVNDAPTCSDVTLTTSEDTPGERDPACADIDGDALTYSIVAQATKGTASVVAGRLHYVPNLNTTGSDSFTYRASDGPLSSAPATVSVTVNTVNDAPTCSDVALTTNEDVAGEQNPSCSDIDGNPLSFSIASQGSKGTASVVAGKLRYVPNPNANGADSFTYRAGDGSASSAPATVSVTIAAVNDAPTCAGVALTTDEDITGQQDPSCADIDGDALTYTIVGQGTHGNASVAAGKLRYTPNANFNGSDSFTYRAGDASSSSGAATVAVTVNAVNDAPSCSNVGLTTDEDVAGERDPACGDVDGDTLTYSIAGQATHGTASVLAGKLRYAPSANFSGADSFTYQASDGAASSAAATVSVTVNPVNDAPTCSDATLATSEDTLAERDPVCSDVDSGTLSYSIVASATKGTASVVAARLRYVPNLNATGADSFTYRASDGGVSSAPATVSVTIAPVNDAPTCADVSLTTNEDVAAERDPSCADVDSGSLTYSIVSQGTKGSASVVAGRLRYVPNPNVNGADSFTYRASDGALASAPATVSVTINAVNTAPGCLDLSLATDEDVPAERDPSCTDVDSGSLSYSIVAQGTKGSASVVAGKLRYVPHANVSGADSFTYKANDGTADSNVATVSVTIAAVNDAPVAQDLSVTTAEDTPKDVSLVATDAEGSALGFSIVTPPAHGTLSGTGASRTYTPAANYNGPDSFTYKANDGTADSNVATVSVTVTAVNDPPVAQNLSASTPEDTPKDVTLAASDVEGSPLGFSIVAGPAHGTLSGTGANRTYTPAANYSGPDSFTYKANDGAADSNIATVSVTVTSVNDPPVAQDVSVTTSEDTPTLVTLDASDVEGEQLSYTIVTQPAHGTLVGTGAIRTYTPDLQYTGPDSFTYKANDGFADSNVATVTVTVTPLNDPPSAQDLTASTPEDTPKGVVLSGTDVDGDTLGFTVVTQPAHGGLFGGGANRTYTPDPNYNGPDSFTYRANDGVADSNVATVTLTVTPVNDAPSCPARTLAIAEDGEGSLTPACFDPESDVVDLEIVGQGLKGTASVVGNALRYVANPNVNGADSFTYRATDGSLAGSAATVSVTINSVNDAPACVAVTLATSEETTAERDPSCTDVEGDSLTYSIASGGTKGAASVVAGKLRYVPAANATGPDSFTYRATDGGGLSSGPATVSVTIAPVNDAPTCSNVPLATSEDTPAERDPSCTDVDGDPLTYAIAVQGTKGTASIVADRLRYVPAVNATGADSFMYRATDGGGLSSVPATVSVTIAAGNDAPTCSDVALTTDEDVMGERAPACTDVDGDTLIYSIVAQGSNGTASVVAGKLRYVPSANTNGTDGFTYRASDGSAFSAPASVAVTVTPVNDAPTCAAVALSTSEDVAGETDPLCSDVEGDTLTYSIVAQPSNGTASVVAGKLRYTPDPSTNGADSFTYKAADGATDSNVATVSVSVSAVNNAPVARNVAATTAEDTAKALTLDASDIDGDPLGYTIVSSPSHGALSGTGASRTYTPNANYNGPDSFTYRASDGIADSNVATVTLTVTAVNDAPVANDLTSSTSEDTPKAVTLSAGDVDGDPLGYTIVSGPSHGALSGTGANRTYTPNTNYNGPDSFTYRASDGMADSNLATVSLTVSAVNDAPSCPAQSLTIDEDTTGNVTPVCTDPEGDPISLEIVNQALNGTASVVGSTLRFIPFLDANGADSFTYRGRDGALASSAATVSVTVRPVNDVPQALSADVVTDKGVAKVVTLSGIDFDNDPLTFRIVSLPPNGGLRAGPNASDHLISAGELPYSLPGNQVRYEPNAGFTGLNAFQFRAHDGLATSLAADVRIDVLGVNVAPVCSSRTVSLGEDTGASGTACSDADGDALTFTRTGASHGELTLFSDGTFSYVPNANYHGSDSFTVVARDPSGLTSALATVTLTITPVNDAPTCDAVTLTTFVDTPGTASPDCIDVDGDSLTYEIVDAAANGTATVNGQQLDYVPGNGYSGADAFTYRAGDGALFSGAANVSVTVNP